MELFEIPQVNPDMTKEEAAQEIERFERGVNNNENHPLRIRAHRQHGAFLDYRDRLYQRRYGGSEEVVPFLVRSDEDDEVAQKNEALRSDKAEALRVEKQAALIEQAEERVIRAAKKPENEEAAQEALRVEAEEEMAKLVDLGFRRDEIPGDVQPFQVAALKMQRLNAEGSEESFRELIPMLEQELTALSFSGTDTFRSFARDASIDPEVRAEHIELILKRIYSANQEKVKNRVV